MSSEPKTTATLDHKRAGEALRLCMHHKDLSISDLRKIAREAGIKTRKGSISEASIYTVFSGDYPNDDRYNSIAKLLGCPDAAFATTFAEKIIKPQVLYMQEHFSQVIEPYRKKHKLSQKAMGEKMGTAQQNIDRIEKGLVIPEEIAVLHALRRLGYPQVINFIIDAGLDPKEVAKWPVPVPTAKSALGNHTQKLRSGRPTEKNEGLQP